MNLIEHGKSLKELNWWKVGGVAKNFAAPRTIAELKEAWSWALQRQLKIWVISGGSNVLIQDGELDGFLLSTHALVGVERAGRAQLESSSAGSGSVADSGPVAGSDPGTGSGPVMGGGLGEHFVIRALAGTPKSEAAKLFLQNKLAPAIFLTGIPGDVGAGVVMNAGIGEQRTPREFCEIVHAVEVLRLSSDPIDSRDVVVEEDSQFRCIRRRGSDIDWQYRHSSGWQPGIISSVELAWPFAPDATVLDEVRAQTKKRVSTQPLDKPNCGSVFRNPAGQKSAQLIESCGLKGFRVGGASVSMKHSNFIINEGNATARDVKSVIDHVRATVLRDRGVELRTEVIFIGEI